MKLLSILIPLFSLLFSSAPVQAEINPLLQTSSEFQEVTVERVLAVDEIMVSGDKRIALIGIEGPPLPKKKYAERDSRGFSIKDDDPTTSLEEDAFRFASDLLLGKKVRLEFDEERRNDNNDLQAYVYLANGTMANTELLRQGYADLKLRSPNTKYAEPFRAAYREARKEMRGLRGQW
jgi:endonuclease YncB( thermonuclease family)